MPNDAVRRADETMGNCRIGKGLRAKRIGVSNIARRFGRKVEVKRSVWGDHGRTLA